MSASSLSVLRGPDRRVHSVILTAESVATGEPVDVDLGTSVAQLRALSTDLAVIADAVAAQR